MKRLLIFGFGYTGDGLARRLLSKGDWTIAGITRKAEKANAMSLHGIDPILLGDDVPSISLDGVSHLLISAPPSEAGCPALKALAAAIDENSRSLEWIGYLSTNGVYGDHGGAWVDEQSALNGASARAQRRIVAEAQWRDLANQTNARFMIFRLPGIYGPGRSAFDAIRAGRARRIYKEGQVFSRMHVEDIAAAIDAAMLEAFSFDTVNLADDEPAPPQDVIEYACTLLGQTPPPLIALEDAALSEMAKSFYADNKRVSNARMKSALGVTLSFPNYKAGLKAILKQERND